MFCLNVINANTFVIMFYCRSVIFKIRNLKQLLIQIIPRPQIPMAIYTPRFPHLDEVRFRISEVPFQTISVV